jgi:hypothetical protein
MKDQPDLFADDLASARAQTTGMASLKISSARLTPAQQRFNQLLERIAKLSGQIERARSAADAHRPTHSATLTALQQRQRGLMRDMALALDERLQRQRLTAAQKRIATEILCDLCETLAAQGDADMQALHDRHSRHSLHAKKQDEAAEMQAMVEDLLGRPLADAEQGQSPDDLLRAAMQQLDEKAAEKKAKQEARRAKRPKSARQQLADKTELDAQSALRTVFRQLASALHPDRETDPEERRRKTELMSQANAAYDRRDLMALLQLQLQIEQADPESIARMADDKVKALSQLLQQQLSALQQDLLDLQMQLCHEFDLPSRVDIVPASLKLHLAKAQRELEQQLRQMEHDLARVQDDADFKRWLKEQKQLAQDDDFIGDLDLLLASIAGRR